MSSQKKKKKHLKSFFVKPHLNMDVLEIFFSLKLISKETLFPPKFDSRLVNADWLIT